MRRQPLFETFFREIAEALREDPAIAADQHRIGQDIARIAVDEGHIVPVGRCCIGIVDEDRVVDRVACEKRVCCRSVVGGDPDDLQAARCKPLLAALEQGHFLATGCAPARPEIHQDHLAIPLHQAVRATFGVRQANLGALTADHERIGGRLRWRRHRPQPCAGQQAGQRPAHGEPDDQQRGAIEHGRFSAWQAPAPLRRCSASVPSAAHGRGRFRQRGARHTRARRRTCSP